MKTRIVNATVVLPTGCEQVAVLIDGSQIAAIDPAVQTRADETIDATGLHLLPGVIDDQVHFREPGLTHKEDLRHASRACAKGGVTTFFDMPNTNPNTVTQQRLEQKLQIASQQSLVNYGFMIGATCNNVAELANARRTPGIKIFVGSSTGDLLVDDQQALERIFADTTLPIAAHCEDEATIQANAARYSGTTRVADHSRIRDEQAAIIATRRLIGLSKSHDHPLHVFHISTGAEAKLLADHGGLVTGEVCPHHLFFNTSDYDRLGSLVQMNPSLKSAADNRELWQALLDGRIQVIATDHAPHTWEEKQQPYPRSPSGLPSVENSLALLLDQVNQGNCSIEQVAHWMSEAPARVWNVINKGAIHTGFDADLVLVDMAARQEIRHEQQQTKCRWSPWHGTTLTGWPVQTWVMGHCVYRNGDFDESTPGQEARYDASRGGYWGTQAHEPWNNTKC
jgi:dihydroorotase